ncbi:rhomboid family intramembrane serine protease [Jeotgalibacillus soli]|uniref:Rhomboid protease n=1 Tax=Jeotgalibacillus soli TaxID=889306 RepID=A0A0C2R289_9BACL|nr:rhomboid family intramembrane serine protease [Jeotgalibacillus soli]KIL44400.1 rhomboid protease [Jeotgalibacillus soli]
MTTRTDYLYWTVAHDLIVNKGYRLLKISQSQREMWLEGGEKKQQHVVRLVRVDLDWSNRMQRDIDRIAVLADQVRKQLKKRRLRLENIYFSTYEPVDDYSFRIKEPIQSGQKQQIIIKSYVIEPSNGWESIKPIESFASSPKEEPLREEYRDEEIVMLKKKVLASVVEERERERLTFNVASPFFTYVFIALQLFMFYLLETNGGSTNPQTLIEFGAKYNPLIESGDWWRFFTPMVLHIGFLHLLMNTLALFYLGPMIERIFGRSRFLFIYLFSGFTGSLMSFVFTANLSAGASGAIFGCFGALLYFGFSNPKLFFKTMGTNVLVVITINLLFGFTVPGIDNAGHLGGLAGGFLAAGMIHFPKKKSTIKRGGFILSSVVFVSLFLSLGYNGGFIKNEAMTVNALSQDAIQRGELDTAYRDLLTLKDDGQATAETYFLLSFVEIKKEQYEDATQHLELAIERRKSFHEAHYNLALVKLELGEIEEAVIYAQKASQLKPTNENYTILLEKIDNRSSSN